MVWHARDLGDEELAAFAGKLLALTGPLEASAIAFSVPSSADAAAAAPGASARAGRATETLSQQVQGCLSVAEHSEGMGWACMSPQQPCIVSCVA